MNTAPNNAGIIKLSIHKINVAASILSSFELNIPQTKIAISLLTINPNKGGKGMLVCKIKIVAIPERPSIKVMLIPKKCSNNRY